MSENPNKFNECQVTPGIEARADKEFIAFGHTQTDSILLAGELPSVGAFQGGENLSTQFTSRQAGTGLSRTATDCPARSFGSVPVLAEPEDRQAQEGTHSTPQTNGRIGARSGHKGTLAALPIFNPQPKHTMARKLLPFKATYMKEHRITIKADSLKAAAKAVRRLGAKRAVITAVGTQEQRTI